MEIQGSVVVVTGASSGIGLATARSFAHAGAKVVLAARSSETINAVNYRVLMVFLRVW
jgi:NADP-dependent 3-hydroxy acid dehydrogenase YdfG